MTIKGRRYNDTEHHTTRLVITKTPNRTELETTPNHTDTTRRHTRTRIQRNLITNNAVEKCNEHTKTIKTRLKEIKNLTTDNSCARVVSSSIPMHRVKSLLKNDTRSKSCSTIKTWQIRKPAQTPIDWKTPFRGHKNCRE